jgi:hypothetical protein
LRQHAINLREYSAVTATFFKRNSYRCALFDGHKGRTDKE